MFSLELSPIIKPFFDGLKRWKRRGHTSAQYELEELKAYIFLLYMYHFGKKEKLDVDYVFSSLAHNDFAIHLSVVSFERLNRPPSQTSDKSVIPIGFAE